MVTEVQLSLLNSLSPQNTLLASTRESRSSNLPGSAR